MLLGTASWPEGAVTRRALVAPLEDGRVADLNRIEQVRLTKLGEGEAEALADALVPGSLRRVLEAGQRAIQQLRVTLAYAEKWQRKGNLPESLAPRLESVQLLSCLPRPATVRRADGSALDRLRIAGPGGIIHGLPAPSLGAVGLYGGKAAGLCLAVDAGDGCALGTWLVIDPLPDGDLELRIGGHRRSSTLKAWQGLELPRLRAGEVMLLPPPRFKALPELPPGLHLEVRWPFETMALTLGKEIVHPTVQ